MGQRLTRRCRAKPGLRRGAPLLSARRGRVDDFSPHAIRRSCSKSQGGKAPAAQQEGGIRGHIITACNEYRQETVVLERSALKNGYSFRAVGVGGPWRSLGTKLALYDKAFQDLVGRCIAPEDPVMLLDAWDTVVLGPATELHAKLDAMGALGPERRVICSADRLCSPDFRLAPRLERLYPEIDRPWRYPNSGGFAGTAAGLADFFRELVRGTTSGPYFEEEDDQLRVQTFLLTRVAQGNPYPCLLDEDCSIFQGMGERDCNWSYDLAPTPARNSGSDDATALPRITNYETGEQPLMAHGCGGNGRWFLADVYRELRLLEYLGVKPSDVQGMKYAGLVAPGETVTTEHWKNLAPWEFPFQAFDSIRAQALYNELQHGNTLHGDTICAGDSIFLQSHTKNLLDVEDGHVLGRWEDRGTWQTFVIEKPDGSSTVCSGDVVHFRCHTGKYLDVEDTDVQARFRQPEEIQRFVIKKSSTVGNVRSGDTVYLLAHSACHVEVENEIAQARWEDQGAWQALIIEKKPA